MPESRSSATATLVRISASTTVWMKIAGTTSSRMLVDDLEAAIRLVVRSGGSETSHRPADRDPTRLRGHARSGRSSLVPLRRRRATPRLHSLGARDAARGARSGGHPVAPEDPCRCVDGRPRRRPSTATRSTGAPRPRWPGRGRHARPGLRWPAVLCHRRAMARLCAWSVRRRVGCAR